MAQPVSRRLFPKLDHWLIDAGPRFIHLFAKDLTLPSLDNRKLAHRVLETIRLRFIRSYDWKSYVAWIGRNLVIDATTVTRWRDLALRKILQIAEGVLVRQCLHLRVHFHGLIVLVEFPRLRVHRQVVELLVILPLLLVVLIRRRVVANWFAKILHDFLLFIKDISYVVVV